MSPIYLNYLHQKGSLLTSPLQQDASIPFHRTVPASVSAGKPLHLRNATLSSRLLEFCQQPTRSIRPLSLVMDEPAFQHALHQLKSDVEQMNTRYRQVLAHYDLQPQQAMNLCQYPNWAPVNVVSGTPASTQAFLPDGRSFWLLIGNLKSDIRGVEARTELLESRVQMIEDEIHKLDPNRFTPVTSLASGDNLRNNNVHYYEPLEASNWTAHTSAGYGNANGSDQGLPVTQEDCGFFDPELPRHAASSIGPTYTSDVVQFINNLKRVSHVKNIRLSDIKEMLCGPARSWFELTYTASCVHEFETADGNVDLDALCASLFQVFGSGEDNPLQTMLKESYTVADARNRRGLVNDYALHMLNLSRMAGFIAEQEKVKVAFALICQNIKCDKAPFIKEIGLMKYNTVTEFLGLLRRIETHIFRSVDSHAEVEQALPQAVGPKTINTAPFQAALTCSNCTATNVELEGFRSQISDLESQKAKLTAVVTELQNQRFSELRKASQTKEQTRQKFRDTEVKLEALNRQYAEIVEQRDRESIERKRLETQLETWASEKDCIQRDLDFIQGEKEYIQREEESLRREKNFVQGEKESIQRQKDSVKQEASAARAALERQSLQMAQAIQHRAQRAREAASRAPTAYLNRQPETIVAPWLQDSRNPSQPVHLMEAKLSSQQPPKDFLPPILSEVDSVAGKSDIELVLPAERRTKPQLDRVEERATRQLRWADERDRAARERAERDYVQRLKEESRRLQKSQQTGRRGEAENIRRAEMEARRPREAYDSDRGLADEGRPSPGSYNIPHRARSMMELSGPRGYRVATAGDLGGDRQGRDQYRRPNRRELQAYAETDESAENN